MLNDRLSNLTIISMNNDLLKICNYDAIIDVFAQKQRRINLL